MKTDNCSMYFVMYNETTFLFSKQKLVFIFYTFTDFNSAQ